MKDVTLSEECRKKSSMAEFRVEGVKRFSCPLQKSGTLRRFSDVYLDHAVQELGVCQIDLVEFAAASVVKQALSQRWVTGVVSSVGSRKKPSRTRRWPRR